MKNRTLTILALVGMSVSLLSSLCFAGNENSGGGFYGLVNGQWILLDDLEQGMVIHPESESYFEPVALALKHLDRTVPGFGKDLRTPLEKTWHLVPFPIRCEDPASPVQVVQAAGACQDDNDIFIEESKFNAAAKDQLILHELIQGRRLALNKTRSSDQQVSPANVRGLKRFLSSNPSATEAAIQDKIEKYGFGTYQTYSEITRANEKAGPVEEQYNEAMDLFHKHCNAPIADLAGLDGAQGAYFALSTAYREADWIAHGGEAGVSTAFRDLCNLRRSQIDSARRFCSAQITVFVTPKE
ncbi:MAG TPA: hypothetical protein DCS07_05710 [Bdellovibrionales bacterium]|nr:MAG: hypothetical protein A2X97_10220 [Bdellovibrionales bacterium GWA1_52_35]HAR42115.1 hypothetical protein [Bdellovibrionales bacterium]HCM38712.1 hypothetical protein [Bdellovibrionales bacterium]